MAGHRLWQPHQACAAPVDHTADKLGERGKIYYWSITTPHLICHILFGQSSVMLIHVFQQFFFSGNQGKRNGIQFISSHSMIELCATGHNNTTMDLLLLHYLPIERH